MMKFKEWQILHESLGSYNLGLRTTRSIGVMGSKLAEMGLSPDDVGGDLGGMGGGDDLGGLDGGMGGGDFGGMDGGQGGLGSGPGGKITIQDLDPQLLALLGLGGDQGGLGGQDDGMGGFGGDMGGFGGQDDGMGGMDMLGMGGSDGGDMSGDEGPGDEGDDSEDDSSSPFGGSTSGSSKKSSPFGDEDADDDDDADDETGSPFGGVGDDSDGDDSDGDADDDDDDSDGDSDNEDADDDLEEVAPKGKKFMKKGGNCCENDRDFLSSLVDQGRGTVHRKWSSGMKTVTEDALFKSPRKQPGPGDVGYAPQGIVGNNFPSVHGYAEWKNNKTSRRSR